VRWIAFGRALNWGSHHTSSANLITRKSAVGMGWRGAEKVLRWGEWLEKWLGGYAIFA